MSRLISPLCRAGVGATGCAWVLCGGSWLASGGGNWLRRAGGASTGRCSVGLRSWAGFCVGFCGGGVWSNCAAAVGPHGGTGPVAAGAGAGVRGAGDSARRSGRREASPARAGASCPAGVRSVAVRASAARLTAAKSCGSCPSACSAAGSCSCPASGAAPSCTSASSGVSGWGWATHGAAGRCVALLLVMVGAFLSVWLRGLLQRRGGASGGRVEGVPGGVGVIEGQLGRREGDRDR